MTTEPEHPTTVEEIEARIAALPVTPRDEAERILSNRESWAHWVLSANEPEDGLAVDCDGWQRRLAVELPGDEKRVFTLSIANTVDKDRIPGMTWLQQFHEVLNEHALREALRREEAAQQEADDAETARKLLVQRGAAA